MRFSYVMLPDYPLDDDVVDALRGRRLLLAESEDGHS